MQAYTLLDFNIRNRLIVLAGLIHLSSCCFIVIKFKYAVQLNYKKKIPFNRHNVTSSVVHDTIPDSCLERGAYRRSLAIMHNSNAVPLQEH